MTTNTPLVRYLVYGGAGAGLLYSGTDPAAYTAARQAAERDHAGALVGQSMMGRERWVVAAYLKAEPDATFIRRRRESGLLGLTWEPVDRGGA